MKNVPYKIFLQESEIPRVWYNIRADMPEQHAPIINPGTMQPIKLRDAAGILQRIS